MKQGGAPDGAPPARSRGSAPQAIPGSDLRTCTPGLRPMPRAPSPPGRTRTPPRSASTTQAELVEATAGARGDASFIARPAERSAGPSSLRRHPSISRARQPRFFRILAWRTADRLRKTCPIAATYVPHKDVRRSRSLRTRMLSRNDLRGRHQSAGIGYIACLLRTRPKRREVGGLIAWRDQPFRMPTAFRNPPNHPRHHRRSPWTTSSTQSSSAAATTR